MWFSSARSVTVYPGKKCTVTGLSKFPGQVSSQAVLIDSLEEEGVDDKARSHQAYKSSWSESQCYSA